MLRRLTFYNWNRWYLLLYTAASFLIPFIDISVLLQRNNLSGAGMVKFIPAMERYAGFGAKQVPALARQEPVMSWWMIVFLAGVLIVFTRLMIQLISMYRLRSKASLLIDEEVKLYQVDEDIAPFSFGNAIFVNRQLHDVEELKKIISHEFVHVRQRHSLDVLWGEMLCMLNWYNPFAWLIRRSIRQNLEFIADNQVLGSGVNKKQYQYLLLKVTGGAQFRIASQFNFSSLKKRIIMMNKVRTAKVHLLRFFFVLPLAAVLLLAFRSGMGQNASRGAQAPVASADTTKPTLDEFNKRNPSVQRLGWKSKPHRVVIHLKNGTEEVYNLENEAERNKAIRKYGNLPIAPPPPPPVPVAPGRAPEPPQPADSKEPPSPPAEMWRPTPPVPAKAAILPKPPAPAKAAIPPTPPVPAEIISLESDEITFQGGRIILTGNVLMKEVSDKEIIELKLSNVVWDTNSLVMVDGQEVAQNKTQSGRFEVKTLTGDEAVKKYGEKAKNGVVELTRAKE